MFLLCSVGAEKDACKVKVGRQTGAQGNLSFLSSNMKKNKYVNPKTSVEQTKFQSPASSRPLLQKIITPNKTLVNKMSEKENLIIRQS